MPPRGAGLGSDARLIRRPRRDDSRGDKRLEIPVRPGQGSRGLALPAPTGEAGRVALGTRFQGPPVDAGAGRGVGPLLQERPELWRGLSNRRHRSELADSEWRVAERSVMGENLSVL